MSQVVVDREHLIKIICLFLLLYPIVTEAEIDVSVCLLKASSIEGRGKMKNGTKGAGELCAIAKTDLVSDRGSRAGSCSQKGLSAFQA
jgi:hypothetical protein